MNKYLHNILATGLGMLLVAICFEILELMVTLGMIKFLLLASGFILWIVFGMMIAYCFNWLK